jgi:hypothetical protein
VYSMHCNGAGRMVPIEAYGSAYRGVFGSYRLATKEKGKYKEESSKGRRKDFIYSIK